MSQVCLLYLFVQFSSSRFRFTTEIVKVQNTVGLQKKMWIEKNVLKQSECIECLICVVVAIGFDGLYCPLSFCSSLLQPACPQCCRGRYLVVCAWGPFMLLWLSSLFCLFVQHLLRPSDLCSPPHSVSLSLAGFCSPLIVCVEKGGNLFILLKNKVVWHLLQFAQC